MSATSNEPLSPFFMWAGGKTRMLKHYRPVWPTHSGPYVEPFLGGGAVFGWVHAETPGRQSVLGDVNAELIDLMKAVRDDVERFILLTSRRARNYLSLSAHEERKEWYYRKRAAYWRSPNPFDLYILMRLGFNGVWQTCRDSKGLYGTPAGLLKQTSLTQIVDKKLLRAWSAALRGAVLHTGSYEDVPLPRASSLIYLDPPYRGSFTDYATGFDDDDQKRLAEWYRDRAREGHQVILANRCVDGDTFFEDLLADIAQFHYFDVTYTAGRRAATSDGYKAKAAREFIAVSTTVQAPTRMRRGAPGTR